MTEKTSDEPDKELVLDFPKVMDLLSLTDNKTVTVEFNGNNGNGSIFAVHGDGKGILLPELQEIITDWAYTILDVTPVRWIEDDGGFGEIVINVKNRSYSCEIFERYNSSRLAYSDIDVKIETSKGWNDESKETGE